MFLSVGSFEFLYALSTALKLIMLMSAQGWDPARARQEIDIDGVMGRLIRSMKTISDTRSTRRRYAAEEIPGLAQDPFDRLTMRIIELGHCLCKLVLSDPNVPESVVGAARAMSGSGPCGTVVVGGQSQPSVPMATGEQQQYQQYQQFTQQPQQLQTQQEIPTQLHLQHAVQHQIQQVHGSEHMVSPQNDPQNLWTGDDVGMAMDLDTNSWPELITEWAPYFTQAAFEDFSAPNF